MTDTELQFDNITPQNLKDNETIYKLLKLYNSSFEDSVDILENPLNLLDTDFLIKKYEDTADIRFDEVRREIFKIHLQEIFQTFEEIGDSEEIYNKFKSIYESLNVPTDDLKIVADIDKSIDSQYLDASKSFKTKKGTRSGFFFVYDIINRAGIQAINADEFFNLIEGTEENPNTPYEYTVETSLYKEVFQKTVVPLAHPVGFNWNFIRLLFLTMEDYFGLEQIKTLGETTLTCYGSDQTAINQVEIVNSGIYGSVKDFLVSEDQDKNEQVIIDYNPLDGSEGNGIRFIKEFNGRIMLYDRQSVKELKDSVTGELTGENQYLEIEEIRLVQEQNGLLSINKIQRELLGETFEVIESVEFKEYTIIDKDNVEVEFRIRGDFEDKWNPAKLMLTNKIVSDEIKFYEPELFDRQAILDSSSSYNGRIIEDKGSNCLLNYKATYSYKVSTKDISDYVESVRPYSLGLETDVNDIIIAQSEYDIAISEGKDPYKDLYATHDHTVEEIDFKDTHENFGRLVIGNIPRQYSPYKLLDQKLIGDETLIIDDDINIDSDTDWRINWWELHIHDIGFNSNDNRWENYFVPDAQTDLNVINSTMPLYRYLKDNLEWYGNKGSGTMPNNFGINFLPSNAAEDEQLIQDIEVLSQDYLGTIRLENNGEYIAWESYTMEIFHDIREIQQEISLDYTNYEDIAFQDEDYKWSQDLIYTDVKADPVNLQVQTYENFKIRLIQDFGIEDYGKTYDGILEINYNIQDFVNIINYTWNNDIENFDDYNDSNYISINGTYEEKYDEIITFNIHTSSVYKYWTFYDGTIGDTTVLGEDIVIEHDTWYIGMDINGTPLSLEDYKDGWNYDTTIENYTLYDYHNLIGSKEHYEVVEAEVYKGIWNYDNGIDDDNILLHIDQKHILDDFTLDILLDSDGILKPALDIDILISEVISTNDSITGIINEIGDLGKDITDDSNIIITDNITQGEFINKEFTDEIFTIGDDLYIGDETLYVGMVAIYVTYTDAEPYGENITYIIDGIVYTEVSSFNSFSDTDDFNFGVYRNDVLLEDNNVAAY